MAIKFTAIKLEPGDKLVASTQVESEDGESKIRMDKVVTFEDYDIRPELGERLVYLTFRGIEGRFDSEYFLLHSSTKVEDLVDYYYVV